jgi:tyrocidine synthetase-3
MHVKTEALNDKNVEDIIALTPMQEGMLSLYLKDPEDSLYVEQLCLEVSGNMDTLRFRQAWNFIVRSNQVLRSLFRWENIAGPVQVILKEYMFDVEYCDLSRKEASEKLQLLEDLKDRDRKKGFDLREVPFRVTLVCLAEEKYAVIITNHHILYDGWSSGIILREFFQAYDALSKRGKLPEIPAKTPFKEYVKWLQTRETAGEEASWQEFLQGFERCKSSVPVKRSRKRRTAGSTGSFRMRLPVGLENALENCAGKHNTTVASLLYTAWGILLQQYENSTDVLFDTTVSGRSANLRGIENIVGLFINTLPMRVQTLPGDAVSDLLQRVSGLVRKRETLAHTSLKVLNQFMQEYRREKGFDSLLVLENYPLDLKILRETAALSIDSFSAPVRSRYDLTIVVSGVDILEIDAVYDEALFDTTAVQTLTRCFKDILEDISASPGKQVNRLAGIPGEERERLFKCLEERTATFSGEHYIAPRDEVEQELADLWKDVLFAETSPAEKPPIGIDDHFLDLGGHSLTAGQLSSRIYHRFQVKVSMAKILERPFIRQLAEYIKAVDTGRPSSIAAVEKKEYYPVSAAQKRMYTLWQMESDSLAYNVPAVLRVTGRLEKECRAAFERTFERLIRRHESLRTGFLWLEGEPVQRVYDRVEFKMEEYPPGGGDEPVVPATFVRPFDLADPPLLRVGLVPSGQDSFLLLVDVHHIVSDGSSMNVLIEEFGAYYSGHRLPPLHLDYKDFSDWQHTYLASEAVKQQETYWLERFSGEIPVLNLPVDYPVATGRSSEGDTLYVTVDKETRQHLSELEYAAGVTLYMVLMAAYNVLLMRYSSQEDIIVGTVTDGRVHPDLERIVGVLITTLAMRNFPLREKTFNDFLLEVKTNALAAFENSDYPFEELLKKLRLDRETHRNPLFDTMLLLQNFQVQDLSQGALQFTPGRFPVKTSAFDLRITALEIDEGIEIEIQYAAGLFKKTSIERMARHYINILKAVGINRFQRLGDIDMMTEAEKHRVLVEFNNPVKEPADVRTMYRLFADRAAGLGDRVAVTGRKHAGKGGSISIGYGELDNRAGHVSGILREKGVGPGSIVAVLMELSIEMIAVVLGILKAGAAYLPIDPDYPPERIRYMLADSSAKLAVGASSKLALNWETENCQLSIVNCELLLNVPVSHLHQSPSPAPSLAYVIYTSGSTGKPKGAGVYQRGLFNLITWFNGEFGFDDRDRNVPVTSVSFDLTQKNLFAPLVSGGTIVVPGTGYFEPRSIRRIIRDENVTWLNCTPGMMYRLIETGEDRGLEALSSLRYVFLGGEPVSMARLRDWIHSPHFNAEPVNTYGPTECTDVCAYYRIRQPRRFEGETVPIGKPTANTCLYILDPWQHPLPVGIAGELYIGGIPVGSGYINQPELTAATFFSSPFTLHPSPRYKTGDLARRLPDGNIEYLGRIDLQVKVRGYRIELGEIEHVLLSHPAVKEVAVVAGEDHGGSVQLKAYIVTGLSPLSGLPVPVRDAEIREFLSSRLPHYMIPAYLTRLEALPLNANGKLDHAALRQIELKTPAVGSEYAAPAGENEKRLASIWQEVLEIERVGVNDNFFHIGGDSIDAIRIVSRLRKHGLTLSIADLFAHPTIRQAARYLDNLDRKLPDLETAAVDEPLEMVLSPMQQGMLFHALYREGTGAYVEQTVFSLDGEIDVSLLERSFNRLVERYDIFRTVFLLQERDEPVQIVLNERKYTVSFKDIAGVSEAEQERYLGDFLRNDRRRGFDPGSDRLVRIALFKTHAASYKLVWTSHHILMDGWCLGIVFKDWTRIYEALRNGDSPVLEPVVPYADYIYWLQRQDKAKGLNYWKRYLEGCEQQTTLPWEKNPLHLGETVAYRAGEFRLPPEETEPWGDRFREIAARNRVTVNTLFQVLWGILLQRYNNTSDVVFGAVVSGRSPEIEGIEEMVGLFINTVPVRVKSVGRDTFERMLSDLHGETTAARDYEYLPLADIQASCSVPGQLIGHIMVFENYPLPDALKRAGLSRSCGFSVRAVEHYEQTHYDFNIVLLPQAAGSIEVLFRFNEQAYDTDTMRRIANHFIQLARQVIANPAVPIEELTILTQEERSQVLYTFNDTAVDCPSKVCIHRLFEDQAQRTPHSPALLGKTDAGEVQLSYDELNRRADRLAALLRQKGVCPGMIIAVLGTRTVESVIGIFGILKAGAAYLPIDPEYPRERIDYMLKDSGAKQCLNDLNHEGHEGHEGHEKLEDFFHPMNCPAVQTANPAYVIYTSGSTGKPRGVMIGHGSVVNLIKGIAGIIPFSGEDCILSLTTISFDIFAVETLLPLTMGSRVVIGSREQQLDPAAAALAIVQQKVNIFQTTPSRLTLFLMDGGGQAASALNRLSHLLVTGETFPPALLRQVRKVTSGRIYNLYGPTETTIFSTLKDVTGEEALNIGKPIANTQVYILSCFGTLQPVGVPGQLYIAGDGLAPGYINNPELTAEKFVISHLSLVISKQSLANSHLSLGSRLPMSNDFTNDQCPMTNDRFYTTGDLACWLPDGNIQFLGRQDFQVKIRGYRIELSEIEQRLTEHTHVEEAVVVARGEEYGSHYLCAYITGSAETEILREHLSRTLPDYMIPSCFVHLEQLPLTPNGKIDRNALPEHGQLGLVVSAYPYRAPADAVEEKLAAIWSEVLKLGKDTIGRDAHFFRLGGHSLRAMLTAARIQKEWGVKLALAELFRFPFLQGLANKIKEADSSGFSALEPVEEKEYYELSSAQKRLYILQQMEPDSTAYNLPQVLCIDTGKGIDIKRLETAFGQLIARHESLRTSFPLLEDERPVQRVHNRMECLVAVGLQRAESSGEVERQIEDFVRPFDLACLPLIRTTVIETGSKKLLLIDMHHIITDGTSQYILTREFMHLYSGKTLPPLRLRYKDFSEWQARQKERGALRRQEQCWLNEFKTEVPKLNLPTNYTPRGNRTHAGDVVNFSLDNRETRALKELALAEGTSLFMVLFAVFNILLSKLCGQTDIVSGTTVSGRRHADLQQVTGIFVNLLAVRILVDDRCTFREFLAAVKEKMLTALENQDYPFEDLVAKVVEKRDYETTPLVNVTFDIQNVDNAVVESSELKLLPFDYRIRKIKSKFDLSFTAEESAGQIHFTVEYCTDLFTQETVDRMAGYYKNIVLHAVSGRDPGPPISAVEIVSAEEKTQLLVAFNDTAALNPIDRPLQQLFQDRAHRTPDRIAVGARVWHTQPINESPLQSYVQVSYRELNKRVDRLAGVLMHMGVKTNTITGIIAEPSQEMVLGILAILKAGAAYLPIDNRLPLKRVLYMLDDCRAQVLLATSRAIEHYPLEALKSGGRNGQNRRDILLIDRLDRVLPEQDKTDNADRLPACLPHHPAYVVFTSGSGGNPKGVLVEQQNILTNLNAFQRQFKLTVEDTVLQQASCSFDTFAEEVFPVLTAGGKLAVPEQETVNDTYLLCEFIRQHRVTVVDTSPLMLNALNHPGFLDALHSVRVFISGGDVLKEEYIDNLRKTGVVYNTYGPTEATICAAYYRCEGTGENPVVPIGKPITNYTIHILDRNLNLQPIGVPGELCISGPGVSRGYLNNPELTAEKFISSPFTLHPSPLFLTGDMACWMPDGNIRFLGRIDRQVKIRGFRIETGEIEAHLLKHEQVEEAVVAVKEVQPGDPVLCAYIVPTGPASLEEKLRYVLSQTLPDYMIPAYFVEIGNIPLTSRGKTDFEALPLPGLKAGEDYEKPENEMEERLLAIWSDILGVPEKAISTTANFFQLGGHSLRATTMLARIHKLLDIRVPTKELFRTPTIRGLARYLAGSAGEGGAGNYIPVEPVEKREYYQLSSAQKRIYVLQQMEPDSFVYNVPLVLPLAEEPEKGWLENIFTELIERHESLRTSFHMIADQPVQKIHDNVPFAVEYREISVNGRDRDQNDYASITGSFLRPFDLSQAPLLRVGVVKTGTGYVLLADVHHIIIDEVSHTILTREFNTLAGGRHLPPPPPIQYKDYACWQNRQDVRERMEKSGTYWLERFKDSIPVLDLPADFPRLETRSSAGDRLTTGIDREDTDALRKLALETDTTLFILVLSVFNILLGKWCDREDIVLGTPVAGRPHADLEGIIGMFVNMLVLRNRVEPESSFISFLEQVQKDTLDAFDHQDYQYDELVARLLKTRHLDRNQLVDVVFVFEAFQPGETEETDFTGNYGVDFDFTLTVREMEEHLVLVVDYSTALFKAGTIGDLLEYFVEILHQVTGDPHINLADIQLSHDLALGKNKFSREDYF